MRFLIIFAVCLVLSRAAPVEEPSAAAEAAAGELVEAVEQDIENDFKDEVLLTTTAPNQDQAMKEEEYKKEEDEKKRDEEENKDEKEMQEEEEGEKIEEVKKELYEVTEFLAQMVILEKFNNLFDRLDSFLP